LKRKSKKTRSNQEFAHNPIEPKPLINTPEMQKRSLVLIILVATLSGFGHAQSNADCSSAMDICEKKTYTVSRAGGEGSDNKEADFVACFMNGENFGQAEENSTWIKFEIEKSGSLVFTITPQRKTDDIDFVLFRLPKDGNCQYKQIVRCMAAGDSEGNAATSPCMGATGLKYGETDTSEDAGCNDPGDNTWLKPLDVQKGEKYVLLVSNVSTRGPGFSISFGGSAKLPCDKDPEPTVVAEKPKPKPKPETKPAPKPAVASTKPAEIGGRKVEVGETVKVKNKTIKIKIWDSQVEDGDICSIFLNDKKVIDHIYLRKQPKEFEITLPPGKEHYLTVYADDFGKAEPNSAMVVIYDGVREQTIDLVAERSKQESVKIIVE
jgi:hypothetical protein